MTDPQIERLPDGRIAVTGEWHRSDSTGITVAIPQETFTAAVGEWLREQPPAGFLEFDGELTEQQVAAMTHRFVRAQPRPHNVKYPALRYRDERDMAQQKLDAIAQLEVHGREFVDAAELYTILGLPIPDPIDHAANLRARVVATDPDGTTNWPLDSSTGDA